MATNGPRAIGYIRRSSRVNLEPGMSWELQVNAIHALAARYGVADLELLWDWGKSGGAEKRHLRAGWAELHRRLEARVGPARLRLRRRPHGAQPARPAHVLPGLRGDRREGRLPRWWGAGLPHPRGQAPTPGHGQRGRVPAGPDRREGEGHAPHPPGARRAGRAGALWFARGRPGGSRRGGLPRGRLFTGAARRLNEWGVPSFLGRLWRSSAVEAVLGRTRPS